MQDIAPGTLSANPVNLRLTGAYLFFSTNDGTNGPALWSIPLTNIPYLPARVAARTYIQAEDYDRGDEGLAYHDSDPVNVGGQYRTAAGVDLTTVNSDGSGGIMLGWTKPGEWLNYTLDIVSTSAYTLEISLATAGTGGSFHLARDSTDISGPITVPDTGGWRAWRTITGPALSLPAGRHTLRLVFDSAGATGYVANIDWLMLDGASDPIYLPMVRR